MEPVMIEFVKFLKGKPHVKHDSKYLSSLFNTDRSTIMTWTKEARRAGYPISTDNEGYWYETEYTRYMESLGHLKERAMSQLKTITMAEKNCILVPQLNLFNNGGSINAAS